MSTPSDLQQLVEMGFDKERAELAVKKSGGCRYNLETLLTLASYPYHITQNTDHIPQ